MHSLSIINSGRIGNPGAYHHPSVSRIGIGATAANGSDREICTMWDVLEIQGVPITRISRRRHRRASKIAENRS